MNVYLLISCKEKNIELLDINIYRKLEDAYKEMKSQYDNEILNNKDSVISSNLGGWGANIVFQYDNKNLPYVWSISEKILCVDN